MSSGLTCSCTFLWAWYTNQTIGSHCNVIRGLVDMYVFQTKIFSTWFCHYDDVIMSTIASQITSLTIVYLTIYSGADQSKHQSSASLAFVWGIHRGPVNSPHKWPVTRKMFPFDDVIMWHQSKWYFSPTPFVYYRSSYIQNKNFGC